MRSESYSDGYVFDGAAQGVNYDKRTDIGIYEPGMEKYNQERISTSLRITHNIPRIGFVVTLTTPSCMERCKLVQNGERFYSYRIHLQ